jgi:3-oxoacyl-[acyl-carrier-protein] synthase II
MTDSRRVWITGLGLVTAVGIGIEPFRAGLRAATSPIRAIDRFDATPFRSRVAAQIDAFDPADHMDARSVRGLDRFSQFAVAAGRMALTDAALQPGDPRHPDPERVGIFLGSALGGIAFAEEQHERFMDGGIRRVAPTLALAVFGGAAPANLGISLGVRGPILSTANSCASGAVALGEALAAIRHGEIDAAVAGGVECPLAPLSFGAFDLIRALADGHNDQPDKACRPFDADRSGFVLGEGAALLVLEDAETASRRGVVPYAEVRGYGASSDAYHMVQPRPDGSDAARAVRMALADAGDEPEAMDYVNAHASSTPLGDMAEARALEAALGDRAATVPLSGTKALTGHPLGATAAIEAAMAALAIRDGWAPPSVNLENPDPEIAARLGGLIRDPAGRPESYDRILSTSFGFGGLNAALVFGAAT